MLREIRKICGPFDHHGHVVADIEKAMEDYLAIGAGPWFFITKDRKDRWDAQARAGGGKNLQPAAVPVSIPGGRRHVWN